MSIQWIILIAIIIVLILTIIGLVSRSRRGKQGFAASTNDQIYVGNLPYRISEFELKSSFSKYGRVMEVRIVKNSKTGRSRGYGFVTFKDNNEANNALAANGQSLQGRKIVVRIAKPVPRSN